MSSTAFALSTGEGVLDGVVCLPSGSPGRLPAILLYMDAMGVRPDLVSMADRLASHGYVVVLPNLYYRAGPQPQVDKTAFAVPGPERERVFALMRSINHRMVMEDTRVLLTWLDGRDDVRPGGIGTLGYCMGGGYALTAAGTYPERVTGAASFHGGWLATDRPDSPHLLAPRMRASLYIGVAGIDPLFPPDECARFEQALRESGCRYTLEIYEGAGHGFAVTGHHVYDRVASERHWERLLEHFGAALGPSSEEAV